MEPTVVRPSGVVRLGLASLMALASLAGGSRADAIVSLTQPAGFVSDPVSASLSLSGGGGTASGSADFASAKLKAFAQSSFTTGTNADAALLGDPVTFFWAGAGPAPAGFAATFLLDVKGTFSMAPVSVGQNASNQIFAALLVLGLPDSAFATITQQYGVGGVPQGTSFTVAPSTSAPSASSIASILLRSATPGGLDALLQLNLFLPFDTPLSFWLELLATAASDGPLATTDFSSTAVAGLFIADGVGYTATGSTIPIGTLGAGAVPEPALAALVALAAVAVAARKAVRGAATRTP